MNQKIRELIQESISVKQSVLADEAILQTISKVVTLMTDCFASGKRVFFCGNGGSASDAQHLAAEFSGRFYLNRRALPAEALHCNTSYLTAVANDYNFDEIYARLVEGTLNEGDILVGLSTSGNSPNIVKAFEVARKGKIITVGFTGADGGKLRPLSDHLFAIPSKVTPRIQESHILIGHIICEMVEAALFPNNR
jgi:D-sedoheptulose 7-phosphate isomerase